MSRLHSSTFVYTRLDSSSDSSEFLEQILKFSDSSDLKFNCNADILIGGDYYWDFVPDNIKRGNSGPVAV